MPYENYYRRINDWLAIIITDAGGYRIILRRTEQNLDDALAIANEVLTGDTDEET